MTSLIEQRSTSPRPKDSGSAVSAWLGDGISRRPLPHVCAQTCSRDAGASGKVDARIFAKPPHVPGADPCNFWEHVLV